MPTSVPPHDPEYQASVAPEPPDAESVAELPLQRLDGLADAEEGAEGAVFTVMVTLPQEPAAPQLLSPRA